MAQNGIAVAHPPSFGIEKVGSKQNAMCRRRFFIDKPAPQLGKRCDVALILVPTKMRVRADGSDMDAG